MNINVYWLDNKLIKEFIPFVITKLKDNRVWAYVFSWGLLSHASVRKLN